mmetsp:Transcript_8692/g.13412  ORF Transcript_8692/g.13412 Transcript_8692/m.13412 type:complete len:472 (+) Transcript_8692:109-1524(+)|eukprot:CAMPEP_0202727574 /NCGR_PEP_ID=MMETSP1385-20130828/185191_1 /ASSEMBLY_ACC=CAM_ASM_000861 /TAXON_ID=933848 /ORGANISM="Elphidium margaritaceum" /LENGTH=471 /DNA_ID=CAMNT_0049393817 /DNA_START=108 /DNA_END=1523 /DNA_ORIENTATION=+
MMHSFNELISDSFDCIETEFEMMESFLVQPAPAHKTHTLVLDIDETLLSVRRWIDEVQTNDFVAYKHELCQVVKLTKEVTLQYDDGVVNVYTFYFTQQQPFGQLSSPLDVGDRMDIGGRLASVKEVLTSQMTVMGVDGQAIEIGCLNDDYLSVLTYHDNGHDAHGKFSKPDLVHDNMYLVRFRDGLCAFFKQMAAYKQLDIILWTAAVRSVYTPLMQAVERKIKHEIGAAAPQQPLWSDILFRDNCTSRADGSYFKDLALLGRDYACLIMVDNISFNFQGFEFNGLPIQEYWGHVHDTELVKLCRVMHDVLAPASSCHSADVRAVLHRSAFAHEFSTFKLDAMLKYVHANNAKVAVSTSTTSSSNASASSSSLLKEQDDTDAYMQFTASQSSAIESDSDEMDSDNNTSDDSDSIPTALTSAATATASVSNDGGKNLDFYLFNLCADIADDDAIFGDDVDPTILFHNNYSEI